MKNNALFQKKAKEHTEKYAVKRENELKRREEAPEPVESKKVKVEEESTESDSESSEASWSDSFLSWDVCLARVAVEGGEGEWRRRRPKQVVLCVMAFENHRLGTSGTATRN